MRYRIYGLTIACERPLPLLPSEPDGSRIDDIRIVFGAVTHPEIPPSHIDRDLVVFDKRTALFDPGRGLRFSIEDGTLITAEVPSGLSEAEMLASLFGPPMAWLLHQRGTPPLHACAVKIGSVAVALAGGSRAGKSTFARALIKRGHGLLTDDHAVIDTATMEVHPGVPAVKLWADAARMAGDTIPVGRQVRAGFDKFQIPLPASFHPEPAPLGLVMAVGPNPDISSHRICRLTQREQEAMLQAHIYRADAARRLDCGRTTFAWTLAVAGAVPVVALERPDDLGALPAMCDEIEALAASAAEGRTERLAGGWTRA